MKYDVKFSCGHEETIELFGKGTERERKIAYFEKYGVCSCCYHEQKEMEKAVGCKEVETFYGKYKREFAGCKTKAGSYNGVTKTIIVYVPENAIAE